MLVYRYNERKTGPRNQSVRMLAHLMDLGVDGTVPNATAKKMVLQQAGGDVGTCAAGVDGYRPAGGPAWSALISFSGPAWRRGKPGNGRRDEGASPLSSLQNVDNSKKQA